MLFLFRLLLLQARDFGFHLQRCHDGLPPGRAPGFASLGRRGAGFGSNASWRIENEGWGGGPPSLTRA
jgi:hypothetical protein